jgi:hypothetical protein
MNSSDFTSLTTGLEQAIEFSKLPTDVQDQIAADQQLAREAGFEPPFEPFSDATRDAMRRTVAAKKDSAMLGESGYDRIEADHYCTPPENVDCLVQHVNLHDNVWECAAGKGDISQRLHEFGHTVWSSDIIDYGFDDRFSIGDFLTTTRLPDASIKAIVTNPPYLGDLPEEFIRHALRLMKPVKGQVAMFLRNEYDCSKGRMDLFGLPPFHKKIVVTKRPRWIAGSTGSPRHNYAWFVWDWRHIAGAAGFAVAHPSFAPKP